MPLGRRTFLKGVAALLALPTAVKAVTASSAALDIEGPQPVAIVDIEIDKLIIGNHRPVNRQHVKNLVALYWGRDILKCGVPIIVTPIEGSGCYQVQDSLHRVIAFRELGQKTVPCMILMQWSHDWRTIADRPRGECRFHRKGIT